MIRFALFLSILIALVASTTNSAQAADNSYAHGYLGHTSSGRGYLSSGYGHSTYRQRLQHGYVNHGYSVREYGHGSFRQSHIGRDYGYYDNYAYPSYSHRGAVQIMTPRLDFRLGH